YLEDVEATEPRWIDAFPISIGSVLLVLVAVLAADALVAARTEGPAPVLLGRPISGQKNAAHVARRARVFQSRVEFVYGLRAKRVATLRTMERHTHRALVLRSMIGDVLELEAGDFLPLARIE